MDDVELVAAVAAGSDSALRTLFGQHAPWLAARLRAALDAADVEDVIQETFIAVWRGAAGYRPVAPVGAWIWGIARHQAALLLRRRGPVTFALAALDEMAGPDSVETVVDQAELDAAVATLGPPGSPDREAWRLVHVEDRPVAEAAVLLGVPAGTVKSRVHRARRLLRLALRRETTVDGGTQ
ncbi:RNA polymerase sigma factor [Actinoplanes sp. NPDC051411]|uniref:RNA polymerase sigma factor n=1 Tax=Actinoplanes sp. NPDC051411 TaxID=3155522 RepID=UPI00341E6E5B